MFDVMSEKEGVKSSPRYLLIFWNFLLLAGGSGRGHTTQQGLRTQSQEERDALASFRERFWGWVNSGTHTHGGGMNESCKGQRVV